MKKQRKIMLSPNEEWDDIVANINMEMMKVISDKLGDKAEEYSIPPDFLEVSFSSDEVSTIFGVTSPGELMSRDDREAVLDSFHRVMSSTSGGKITRVSYVFPDGIKPEDRAKAEQEIQKASQEILGQTSTPKEFTKLMRNYIAQSSLLNGLGIKMEYEADNQRG